MGLDSAKEKGAGINVKLPPAKRKWSLILATLPLCTMIIFSSSCVLFNNAPVISRLQSQKDWVEFSGSSEVECIATDPDEDELSYQWTATGGSFSGQGPIVTWTAPVIADTYVITAMVTDSRGGKTTMQLNVETRTNNPPIIESLAADQTLIKAAESTPIECVATDADGDELTYLWEATDGTISGQGPVITWTAPAIADTYVVTATVADSRGGKATMQLNLETWANSPPIIESLAAEQTLIKAAESISIECAATDPDGDELTYLWEATDGTISGQGPVITWTAPATCATYVITVTVDDSEGGQASQEINIKVQKKPG
jgi:hypothetical protein